MEAETFQLSLTWSVYWLRSYFDSQLKCRENTFFKIKQKIYLVYVYYGNVSYKSLVHSSAGLWDFAKA